VAMRRRA